MRKLPLRLLPSFLFAAIASVHIARPGIQYDEILFGNAALGTLDSSFITQEIGGVPFLLMPYIGALKAYLHYPIFSAFGVSPLTIRLPMILLVAASLQLLLASYRQLGIKLGLGLTVLFALQPSIVMYTRTDVGPSAIELALKLFIFYLLATFRISKDRRALWLISVACLVGVFNKLNFIWFANALFGAYVLLEIACCCLSLREGKKDLAPELSRLAGAAAAYLPSFLYFIVINQQYAVASSFDPTLLQENFPLKLRRVYDILTGISYSKYALGSIASFANRAFALFSLLLLISGFACLLRPNDRIKPYCGPYAYIALVGLLLFAQLLVTNKANAPWHALSLEPVYSLLLGLSIWIIYARVRDFATTRIAMGLAASAIGILALHALAYLTFYVHALGRDDAKPIWSTAIYQLIERVEASEGIYYSADWGFHTQLLAFTQDPEKVKDLLPTLLYTPAENHNKSFESNVLAAGDRPIFVILHPDSSTVFPEAKRALLSTLDRLDRGLTLREEIRDSHGRPQYEIHQVLPAETLARD